MYLNLLEFLFIFFLKFDIFGDCCNLNENKSNNNLKNNSNDNLKNKNNDDKNNNQDDKKDKKEVKNVILLTTGALNPVHKGHIMSLKLAQDYLENKGFVVEKIYLSPSSDIYLNNKKKSGKIDYFYNFEDRFKMCQLAVEDFKKENNGNRYNIEVSDWEGKQSNFVDFPDVIKHFEKDIKNKDKLVFYICGSDHYNNNVKHSNLDNIIVIKRNTDIVSLENKKNHFTIVDNDNSDFSSTKARNLIKKINNNEDVDNNKKELEKYLYKSVIDCIFSK